MRSYGDLAVLLVSIFAAGFLMGTYVPKEAKVCPVVEGHSVITTIDNSKEQVCVYQQHTIGLSSKRKVLP